MDTTILFSVLASIGGASGLWRAAVWFRSRKSRIKIISNDAGYHFDKSHPKISNLVIRANLQISNDKDESVYITDIICTLKENEGKTGGRDAKVFSNRPTSPGFSEPIKIDGRGTKEVKFRTNFPSLDIHPINRVGIAEFIGFFKGGVPLLQTSEVDYEKKWDELPLEMLITLHINGKYKVEYPLSVYPPGRTRGIYGSLSPVEVRRIEKDYLFGKKYRNMISFTQK